VPDTDPEAARHPPRRALPLHATARPTLPRAGPTPAASGQTPPPPLPPSPRLSSRPHPSTHPPALPPSTATTPLPSSLSPLTSTSPPPPRSPSLTRARTRPPPTDPEPTRPCSGGRESPNRGGAGGLLLVCPAGGPAAPWAGRLSALRISSSTGGKVLASPVSLLLLSIDR
jgi:hypothetical protein